MGQARLRESSSVDAALIRGSDLECCVPWAKIIPLRFIHFTKYKMKGISFKRSIELCLACGLAVKKCCLEVRDKVSHAFCVRET